MKHANCGRKEESNNTFTTDLTVPFSRLSSADIVLKGHTKKTIHFAEPERASLSN